MNNPEQLARSKAEALAAVARQSALIPELPELDWAVVLTPADIEESADPVVTDGVVNRRVGSVRVWIWTQGQEGIIDFSDKLQEFRTSGIPDEVLDDCIVKMKGPEGNYIEVPMRAFLKELRSAQDLIHRNMVLSKDCQ